VWDIDSPGSPVTAAVFDFSSVIVGDYDYLLESYSLCDSYTSGGCRYGIANFKFTTELFEIGNSGTPAIISSGLYDVVGGGFTFAHGGQQYLLTTAFGNDQCDTGTPMYEFNGVQQSDPTARRSVRTSPSPTGSPSPTAAPPTSTWVTATAESGSSRWWTAAASSCST
jgi:hypothetical protein